MEWKFKAPFLRKDYYNYYLKGIEKGSMYDIDKKLFWKLLYDGNKEMLMQVFNGKVAKPDPIIGSFELMKYNMDSYKLKEGRKNRLKPDFSLYAKTKRKEDIRYFTNQHTAGYTYFVCWQRSLGGSPRDIKMYSIKYLPWVNAEISRSANANVDCFIYNKNRDSSAKIGRIKRIAESRKKKEEQNGLT